jgi:hypothetical protein
MYLEFETTFGSDLTLTVNCFEYALFEYGGLVDVDVAL